MIPKVSIVLPVFNNEKYLTNAIQSLLNQSFLEFELIIINDGSTDRSDQIIQKFNKQDSRIVYIKHNSNLGLIKTLNEGISLSKTAYIARMDGDDISHPARIEKQYNWIRKNPKYTVVSCWTKVIDPENKVITTWKPPSSSNVLKWISLFKTPIVHPSVLYKKNMIKNVGNYKPNTTHFEDYDLWLRVFKQSSIYVIPETLFSYRIHQKSVSQKHRKYQINEVSKIQQKQISKYVQISLDDVKNFRYSKSIFQDYKNYQLYWRIFKSFSNKASLSKKEKQEIKKWIRARHWLLKRVV